MSTGYDRLHAMSKAELMDALENASRDPQAMMILTELHHRDGNEQSEEMLKLTRRVEWYTLAMLVLTVVNVVAVVITLWPK